MQMYVPVPLYACALTSKLAANQIKAHAMRSLRQTRASYTKATGGTDLGAGYDGNNEDATQHLFGEWLAVDSV